MQLSKAIELTARWWAKQLTDDGDQWNNGDPSMTGGLAGIMARTMQNNSRQGITKEQLSGFKLALGL